MDHRYMELHPFRGGSGLPDMGVQTAPGVDEAPKGSQSQGEHREQANEDEEDLLVIVVISISILIRDKEVLALSSIDTVNVSCSEECIDSSVISKSKHRSRKRFTYYRIYILIYTRG